VFRIKYFHQDRETLLCCIIPTLTTQFRVYTEGRAGMTKTLLLGPQDSAGLRPSTRNLISSHGSL
jgi:hypothetical protein